MTDFLLNILSLGIKPLYEKHLRFHTIISEFRNKLSGLEEVNLTETDIEDFYNKLNNFDFSFILFKKYYRKYIENLNRFKPEAEDKSFDLALLQIALAENKWKPTKPFPIFVHHIKYEYKLTSKPFVARQKKQNRKKLDTPGEVAKRNGKTSSQKWTRVPISRNQPEEKP